MTSNDKPPTVHLGGRDWRRIPYGRETDSQALTHAICPDCGVAPGELHVTNCDVEQCPACGLQLLLCIPLERHEKKGSGVWDESGFGTGEAYGPPAPSR